MKLELQIKSVQDFLSVRVNKLKKLEDFYNLISNDLCVTVYDSKIADCAKVYVNGESGRKILAVMRESLESEIATLRDKVSFLEDNLERERQQKAKRKAERKVVAVGLA